ncbi:MAG: phosphocholine cytidylyltransferase family protein [Verrucomicrobia bacterium]|nr:phosphocholine cytidylyltransferase family protein [Verrucomicrobiota bacterium]
MITAFIYAAGRALRLGPDYADRPKILIEFGGQTLLEWHACQLAEVGVKRLVVITGHKREMIRSVFPTLKARHGLKIKEAVNEHFTEGSVLSFHVSLPDILAASPPVLLMDGDVLYPAEMLRRLIASKHRTALLLDRNFSTADDDPVLVPVRQGHPVDFKKKWQGDAELVGESIGFFKLDGADVPMLIEETKQRSAGERRAESYDEVLRALVLAGRFGYEDVTGLPWTEIDFPEDIEFARQRILPSLEAFRSVRGCS